MNNKEEPMQSTEIITRKTIAATPAQVWRALMFYEQIDEPPPWLLRLLLPRPIRTEGSKSSVGEQAMCLYEGGHLLKQVTHIVEGEVYAFEVAEQQLLVGGGLRLHGGSYKLAPLADGTTQLAVTTRYSGSRRRARILGPLEAWVCHRFHHHLLSAIGRAALGPETSHGAATRR